MNEHNIPQMIFDMLEKHWQEHHEVDNLGAILLTFGDCPDNQVGLGLELFYEAHKDEIGSWETFCNMMNYDVQTLFENMVPMDTTLGAWLVVDGEYKYQENLLISNLDVWEYEQFLEENGFNAVHSFGYGDDEGLHVLIYKKTKNDKKQIYLLVLWDLNEVIEYFYVDFPNMIKVLNDIKILIDMDKRDN